uniref:Uncharacterized protein n=1 Tax=Ascaris lumbricoides TaxID=6252 RepID=A0A0M3IR97_ASCLU
MVHIPSNSHTRQKRCKNSSVHVMMPVATTSSSVTTFSLRLKKTLKH